MRVFLGGTCNTSRWRDELIQLLSPEVGYFNPVIEDEEWSTRHQTEEVKERLECDYCLYVITPNMTGVYSIAEIVDDSNKRPEKTIFCVIEKDYYEGADGGGYQTGFDTFQMKSLGQVGEMVRQNGATHLFSVKQVADFVNEKATQSTISIEPQINQEKKTTYTDEELKSAIQARLYDMYDKTPEDINYNVTRISDGHKLEERVKITNVHDIRISSGGDITVISDGQVSHGYQGAYEMYDYVASHENATFVAMIEIEPPPVEALRRKPRKYNVKVYVHGDILNFNNYIMMEDK